MRKFLTTQDFINKATKKHNNLYDYSKTIYTKSADKVIVGCSIHGDFSQCANSHLKGHGCPKCSIIKQYRPGPSGQFKSTESFIIEAVTKHHNKYTYNKSIYVGSKNKLIITCPKHGDFLQTSNNHLKGQGCPKCVIPIGYNKTDYINLCNSNINNDPEVYIIRCFNEDEIFIKIGLTCVSILKRFQSRLPYSYEIVKEIKGSPDFVYDLEKSLHNKYKNFKYKPLISFGGETECYSLNILKEI